MKALAFCAALLALATPARADDPPKTTRKVAGLDVEAIGDLKGFSLGLQSERLEEGLDVVTVRLTTPTPQTPPSFTLRWSIPSHDVAGVWTPGRHFDKGVRPDWARSRLEPSMFARSAPVVCLFGNDDRNVSTFALSDALDTVLTGAAVHEEDGRMYHEVVLLSEPHEKLTSYTVLLRLDRRAVPYWTALAEVAGWWARQPGMKPAIVPEVARRPMYSTWYNFHQSLDAKVLLDELAIARGLGLESIIIDDGWQTLDTHRGYAYTGDWQPERIPDMKGFVDACHKLGVRVLLWYAVPFVGTKSRVAPRFAGKVLRTEERLGAQVLDPRYPENRAYVIDTYRRALRDWGLDGLKLDFIDRFVADEHTVLEAGGGRDLASVNAATNRMMTDVLAELRRLRPDVMIEFRQPYIGPLIRTFGNMLRAGDCPGSYLANRVKTLDLRLLSGPTAVHADMIMWHPTERVESAALQLLNVLFAVPQVSVRLKEIPADHRAMLAFYLRYWNDNRAVLLDGALEPHDPAANYPLVVASAGDKQIVGLYGDEVVPLRRSSRLIDVVNAKASEEVVLSAQLDLGAYRYVVRDCQGRQVRTGQLALGKAPVRVAVPPSGLLALERARRGP
jgi:alpha-galactosidase